MQRAQHLDLAWAQQGGHGDDAVLAPRQGRQGLLAIAAVGGEQTAPGVEQRSGADLVLAAQACQVLLRRLRRVERQRGQAVVADDHGEHLQVAHHLPAQHREIVDDEQGAGESISGAVASSDHLAHLVELGRDRQPAPGQGLGVDAKAQPLALAQASSARWCGLVFGQLGSSAGGLIGSIVTATVGAVVLLLLVRLIKRA